MSRLVRARFRKMDVSGDGRLQDLMWEEHRFVVAVALRGQTSGTGI
jgi:hypothetical protein